MSDADSESPRYVTCRCQYCDGHLEFDANQLTEENNTLPCPHCGLDTVLFVPQNPTSPPPSPNIQNAEKLPQSRNQRSVAWSALAVAGILIFLIIIAGTLARNPGRPNKASRSDTIEMKDGSISTPLFRKFGTNSNSREGDVVNLSLRAAEHEGETYYWWDFSIWGKQPVNIEKGYTVGIEIDGHVFYTTNQWEGGAETNAQGEAMEVCVGMDWPEKSIPVLTNASNVTLYFNGEHRHLVVPLTEDDIRLLRRFARECLDTEMRRFRPIKK